MLSEIFSYLNATACWDVELLNIILWNNILIHVSIYNKMGFELILIFQIQFYSKNNAQNMNFHVLRKFAEI